MTRSEVLAAITKANEAIKAYNLTHQPPRTIDEQTQDERIKTASIQFIKESMATGAAGQRCPSCNGSGRI